MRIQWRSGRRALISALLVSTLSAWFTGGAARASGEEESTVRVVVSAEPTTLDGGFSLAEVFRVNRNILETLVDTDPATGELLPQLAETWTPVDDDTWEFTLRQDVQFSNGEPFNADAVVFNLSRLYGPGEPLIAAQNGPPMTAEAIDDYTVQITGDGPSPILPRYMFFVPIMAPGATGDSRNVREPVGTGPYVLNSWTGDHILLDANPTYWGDPVSVQHMEFQWREESSVRALMVENDEADIAADLATENFGDLTIQSTPAETLLFRLDPCFADLSVRQALNESLDRDAIVDAIYGGLASPANQVVPPGVVGHSDALPMPEYSPEEARATIDEARAASPDSVPSDVEIIYEEGQYVGGAEVAQVFSQELSDLGFSPQLTLVDHDALVDAIITQPVPEGRCAAILYSSGNEVRDASNQIDNLMVSGSILNTFPDPEFDTMYAAAKALSDETRGPSLAASVEYEAEHMRNAIPVVYYERAYGTDAAVSWTPRPDGFILGETMTLS